MKALKVKQLQEEFPIHDLLKLISLHRDEHRLSRWYFGGLSASAAACFTHPLDLVKVYQQTKLAEDSSKSMSKIIKKILQKDGVRGLYFGISASMLRQLSYATTRSALYDLFKEHIQEDGHPVVPFYDKAIIAGTAGAIAGFIGTPADTVNVRMQHDIKLPVEKRRNYKHALDGIYKIAKNEGFSKLFSGASMASSRAFLMSIGTFSVYDQTKEIVISHEIAHDDVFVHLYVSCFAAFCSTAMVHPVDVLKNSFNEWNISQLIRVFLWDCQNGNVGVLSRIFTSLVASNPTNSFNVYFRRRIKNVVWTNRILNFFIIRCK